MYANHREMHLIRYCRIQYSRNVYNTCAFNLTYQQCSLPIDCQTQNEASSYVLCGGGVCMARCWMISTVWLCSLVSDVDQT